MALVESFSGIRGVYSVDLTDDIARRYAFCYQKLVRKTIGREPCIVVGMDTRPSSNSLKDAIFDSLSNIIDVDVATTPAVEFAVRHFKADGGIIITASHNEPEYNGLKFLDKDGAIFRTMKTLIKDFHKIALLKEVDFLDKNLYKSMKRVEKYNIAKDYFRFLLTILGKKNIDLVKKAKLSIIMDPAGGTAGIADELLKSLNVKVTSVNNDEGTFGRTIEPNEKSLQYLKKVINEKKADFAAGFDLDGDRMAIMLGNGKIVSGNHILALLVDDVLSGMRNTAGCKIVINDATSNVVKAIANKHNATVKEVEVGEINVVEEMYKQKSPVGGEGSSAGAIYPPSRCRDGILSLLFILKILARRKERIETLIEGLPKYFNLSEKISYDSRRHRQIKEKLMKHYSKYRQQITGGIYGGLKIIIDDDSYIWFRASKTEDGVFRIISDSNNKGNTERLLKDAVKAFKSCYANR